MLPAHLLIDTPAPHIDMVDKPATLFLYLLPEFSYLLRLEAAVEGVEKDNIFT